jgi:hypothetical protein
MMKRRHICRSTLADALPIGQYACVGESPRVRLAQGPDGWSAECLVCNAWESLHNKSQREAEQRFGRHLENDYPHVPAAPSPKQPPPPPA